MPAELSRHTGLPPAPPHTPDPAFAARPSLLHLRDALSRAAKQARPSRWNEPAVFFFDPKRQAQLEAARPARPDRFAALAGLITDELPTLLACVEVRRVARTLDGLKAAALALSPHCPAASDLAVLLAVPDDEVFLALAPHDRTGVRLHVRGAATVAQLHSLLREEPVLLPDEKGERGSSLTGIRRPSGHGPHFLLPNRTPKPAPGFQLFAPASLRADGTLPAGFAGCGHWLWPTQPLAAVPRVNGERVVLLGPAVVGAPPDAEPRFPGLEVESNVIQTLSPFQVAEELSRLTGRPVPATVPLDAQPVARAA